MKTAWKPHQVQNVPARLLTGIGYRDHILQVLKQFHWFDGLFLGTIPSTGTYKQIHSLGSGYLKDHLSTKWDALRGLVLHAAVICYQATSVVLALLFTGDLGNRQTGVYSVGNAPCPVTVLLLAQFYVFPPLCRIHSVLYVNFTVFLTSPSFSFYASVCYTG